MKFFIDTADLAEIRDLAATGLVDGVTTNPSLVAKSGKKFLDVVREICEVVPGPVSAEVVATDHATMMKEADKLSKIAQNVVIKVPLTVDGLKTCKQLTSQGIKVNVRHTSVSSPSQRRRRVCARANCDFEKLTVLPIIPAISSWVYPSTSWSHTTAREVWGKRSNAASRSIRSP